MAAPDSDAGRPIHPIARALDWLDARPAWQFLLVLYVARWLVVIGYVALAKAYIALTQVNDTTIEPPPSVHGAALVVLLLVSGPILETLVECTVPYMLFARIGKYREFRPARPWGFIVTSALIMTVLHPIASALLPAFITGSFLAYGYAHFARLGTIHAILATFAFHAAINMVGYAMLATM